MQDATGRTLYDLLLRDRRKSRPVFVFALVVSVVVHALILLIIRVDVPRPSEEPLVNYTIFELPEVETIDPDRIVRPLDEEPPDLADLTPPSVFPLVPRPRLETVGVPSAGLPVDPDGTGDRAGGVPGGDPDAVRDRLRYRMATPQVWRAPSEDVFIDERSPQDRVRDRVASQLGEYNDSVAAEADRRARGSDWTTTDEEGNRWGISPGKIHLGSITIPLCSNPDDCQIFAAAPGRREEFQGRVRTWEEIQIQASRVEAGESFKDRVRAIEERKAKEREARRRTTTDANGTATDPNAKPAGNGTGSNGTGSGTGSGGTGSTGKSGNGNGNGNGGQR